MAFVADVHLKPVDSLGLKKVLGFLENIRQLEVKHLFILGDFFHLWVKSSFLIQKAYRPVLEKFSDLYHSRIKVTYLVGNHDFLITDYYRHRPEVEVFEQPLFCNLEQKRLYLTHGDELCINDRHYQFYKAIIRHKITKTFINSIPGPIKKSIAYSMSRTSQKLVKGKSQRILEIADTALEKLFAQEVDIVIHGHTHRRYLREIVAAGKSRKVYSLGDWSETGSFLFYNAPTRKFVPKQI